MKTTGAKSGEYCLIRIRFGFIEFSLYRFDTYSVYSVNAVRSKL